MASLFAVYLIAVLVIVLRPEGRPERMARLCVLRSSAVTVGKAVLEGGTEVIEVIAAWLAADHRSKPSVLAAAEPGLLGATAPRAENVTSDCAPERPVR